MPGGQTHLSSKPGSGVSEQPYKAGFGGMPRRRLTMLMTFQVITNMKVDVAQLRTIAAVADFQLKNIKSLFDEVKRDLKDLGNKGDRKMDKTEIKQTPQVGKLCSRPNIVVCIQFT
ncbi:unnamed protein product [Tuber aestivum]|uniref:Uncharacterized protein n=1 Tax=Tuber aestivum TaxID=59557 RepID=A0A292Q161_9PEZI|nr:unnamed protein product [Tuber aestivum]